MGYCAARGAPTPMPYFLQEMILNPLVDIAEVPTSRGVYANILGSLEVFADDLNLYQYVMADLTEWWNADSANISAPSFTKLVDLFHVQMASVRNCSFFNFF